MMSDTIFEIEASKPFSESLIWQLNRDYYQQKGIKAWSDNLIPHHLTSNSMVGKTYAELIFGCLKDLAVQGKIKEKVYIVELGAGHGRLAFHLLKHLEKLVEALAIELPTYCYVLTDIVEDNLTFFRNHPQFQDLFNAGQLDCAYFDAIENDSIYLRHAKINIEAKDLNQPLIAIGNYFFDSIPNDLFYIKDKVISSCSISLQSREDPESKDITALIKSLKATFHKKELKQPFYSDIICNELLESYRNLVADTHLFFPKKGIDCIDNLRRFSNKGLLLLSMDKGFHEVANIDHKEEPVIVRHGSLSVWVNYHTLLSFCEKLGGQALFPANSNFHLEIGCLFCMDDGASYNATKAAYQRFIDDFGPDDFNTFKKLMYNNIAQTNIKELIAFLRLSAYDSTIFISLLPRIKQIGKSMSFEERKRLGQTMHQVWDVYFNLNEAHDLAYEIGGLFYDLGFYQDALIYFQYSIEQFGQKADIFYNQALCYYQLRQDKLFQLTFDSARKAYPNNKMIKELAELDLGAI